MIKTGSTFACDMYHFPDAIVSAMNEAGLRGVICGPQTQWPPNAEGDDGAVRREIRLAIGLEQVRKQNTLWSSNSCSLHL